MTGMATITRSMSSWCRANHLCKTLLVIERGILQKASHTHDTGYARRCAKYRQEPPPSFIAVTVGHRDKSKVRKDIVISHTSVEAKVHIRKQTKSRLRVRSRLVAFHNLIVHDLVHYKRSYMRSWIHSSSPRQLDVFHRRRGRASMLSPTQARKC